MTKGWKISLISIGSLLGLVIVVIAVALWLVLTPARLTSIVNRLSDKFITCENHFEDVDLTVFKTFPYIGLNVEGVTLINHLDGSENDTVARINQLSVGINLREYLKNNNIEVTKLVVEDVKANLYTDKVGNCNFDIFKGSDEADTTSNEPFEMPEFVSLQSVKVKSLDATYVDESSDLAAKVDNLCVSVDGTYSKEELDATLSLDVDGVTFNMDGDSSKIDAVLNGFAIKIKGSGGETKRIKYLTSLKRGRIALDGQQYVNDAIDARKGDLLKIEGACTILQWPALKVEDMTLALKDYKINLDGNVSLPDEKQPIFVDLNYSTNSWGVKELLAMLPEEYTDWQEGMSLDADVELAGNAKGELSDAKMPVVTANLKLKDGKFSDRSMLPYDITSIVADLSAILDLNEGGVSDVEITKLTAKSGRNNVSLTGHIGDLLGSMNTDAIIKGLVYLADVEPLLPDDMNMSLDGKATLNLKVHTNLDQLQNSDFSKMKLQGDIGLVNLDAEYDTIYAKVPKGNINIQLPSKMKRGLFSELLSASVTADGITANLPNDNIDGVIGATNLQVAINDIFDSTQPFRMVCDFDFASLDGAMDSIKAQVANPKGSFAMIPVSNKSDKVNYKIDFGCSALHCDMGDSTTVDVAGLAIKGGANYDPSRANTLQQWSPNLDIDFKRGYIDLEQMDYIVQIPDIKFNYKPERCEIASANVIFGNSDFYINGSVTGLEKWLSHEDMLRGDLYLTSNYTNVDDLMDAFSGMGSDADTLEAQRKMDNVDTSAHPFIVPKDVDFTLHTRIKEALAFENEIKEVAGDVQIKDGVAVLNQIGFVCKAARMQLTGMYRTPRVNHIFVGLDFHLLDINIQELVDMIPYVDTIVPLLNDLEGRADFHLCAETYVDAFYNPKVSTMRAAAALTGENLVVLDNKDIDRIAKLLQMKKWREDDSKIHLDSLYVAMTVFRDELEVYPFLLSLHKYQIVAEGRHNLKNNYDYHIELVETPLPVRLAVDVLGTLPNIKFDLSPSLRYKNLYRPAKRDDVDKSTLKLKAMIKEVLEANVKKETREYQGLDNQ